MKHCEPGNISYTSNPPQSKCINCGNFWYSHHDTPICYSTPHETRDWEKEKGKNKKPLFPQKGKMIVILKKNGLVMEGDTMINATKNIQGDFEITGTIIIKNNELRPD